MTPLCATCGASIHDPGRAPFRYPGPTHDPMCLQCHLAPRSAEVVTCVECGMLDDPDGYVGGGRLRRRSLCFSCDLWTGRITEAIEPGKVRRWADQGKVECWRTPGGERRFSAAEIARLVSGQAS